MASGPLNNGDDQPATCPCNEIGSVQSIRTALESEERTNTLVTWLSAETARRLSCQPQQPNLACVRRVGASFSILNGIRDAVRPFLESAKPSEAAEPTYEEAFPSLSTAPLSTATTPNVLVARKKTKKKVSPVTATPVKNDSVKPVKEKRRIQLGPAASMLQGSRQGNKAMLASTSAPIVDRDNNKKTAPEWPAVTVDKKSVAFNNSGATKKTKRRIRPAPATAWGSAAAGNIAALASTDSMPKVPTKADFDEMKQTETWSTKKADDKKPESEMKVAKAKAEPTALRDVNNNSKQNGAMISSHSNKSEPERRQERQNLARVYAALIRNHLVPSTALELHLLVRLLTAKEGSGASTIAEDENAAMFRNLFPSASCCHSFAVDVLTQVKCILRNLPLDIIEGFVNCPPFAPMLPEVTIELKGVVERRKETSLLPEAETISIVGSTHTQMPLLTLPFDHDRDSRHNYRSRDELAVYKNREESRDAFLYQLRAFQNIRGKVVDATQAERSIDRIRAASRNVIQGLLKSNMFWFAQLFCDLLVQIGLVPMEETDKELLNIADKDKLQKLHKRFSAKGTQTSKSSKNLVADPFKGVGTASPVVEAQQHFPGHQEFFFIFILSTDCYSFGIHLKNRLKAEMLKLLSSSDTAKGVEKRLLQLKLLSRFLGLLTFSPSWHDSGFVGGTHYDRLSEFDPDLDILGMVKRAYTEQYLVLTIPWVVEFLRMARWSPTLQKSGGFKRLLALLLGIHHRIQRDENEAPDCLRVNLQLMSLYFETLFGDIIGLERAATIPAASVTELITVPLTNGKNRQPDECPLQLSNSLLFTSNPHVEELMSLLSTQAQTQTKSSSSSRKLTPYSIGGSYGSSTDPLGSSNSASFSPMKSNRRVTLGSDIDPSLQAGGSYQDSPIIGKLVEAFFHQHRDLKNICEFIVDQALKNASSRMCDECVVPLLEQKTLDVPDSDSTIVGKAGEEVMEASRAFLAAELETTIPASLAILCPPTIQPRVRDVASKLSISHATRLGEATIESLVRLESKKLSLDKARQLKKQASASEKVGQQAGKVRSGDQHKATELEDALVALRNALANRMWERRLDGMATVVKSAKEVLSCSKNGGAASFRGVSRSFELGSVTLLMWCLEEDNRDSNIRWRIAADFLGVITLMLTNCNKSSTECFKSKITSYFSDDGPIDRLLELGLGKSGDARDTEDVAEILHDLAKAKLISSAKLDVALIRSLHSQDDKGHALCNHFLSRLEEYGSSAESKSEKNSMAFARLRRELSLSEMQNVDYTNQ